MVDKEALIDDIVQQLSDGMDLQALVTFFEEAQKEWLQSMDEEELLEAMSFYTSLEKEDYEC